MALGQGGRAGVIIKRVKKLEGELGTFLRWKVVRSISYKPLNM